MEVESQKFFFEYDDTIIKLENNLNLKSNENIQSYLKNILLENNLSFDNRYVIEGTMGDYIIWENSKVELIGECS